MAEAIVLTPVAEADLESLTDYLMAEWGLSVTDDFLSRFEEVCELISKTPEIYPFINEKEQIRRTVLTKHNIIFFKEVEGAIYLLKIYDTRQHPSKMSIK